MISRSVKHFLPKPDFLVLFFFKDPSSCQPLIILAKAQTFSVKSFHYSHLIISVSYLLLPDHLLHLVQFFPLVSQLLQPFNTLETRIMDLSTLLYTCTSFISSHLIQLKVHDKSLKSLSC